MWTKVIIKLSFQFIEIVIIFYNYNYYQISSKKARLYDYTLLYCREEKNKNDDVHSMFIIEKNIVDDVP